MNLISLTEMNLILRKAITAAGYSPMYKRMRFGLLIFTLRSGRPEALKIYAYQDKAKVLRLTATHRPWLREGPLRHMPDFGYRNLELSFLPEEAEQVCRWVAENLEGVKIVPEWLEQRRLEVGPPLGCYLWTHAASNAYQHYLDTDPTVLRQNAVMAALKLRQRQSEA